MQNWDDIEFCKNYEQTWEISESEVHYGWLAPGENELELLNDEINKNSLVLDVGCGLGQNLVALAGRCSFCYGLDISPCKDKGSSIILTLYLKTPKPNSMG